MSFYANNAFIVENIIFKKIIVSLHPKLIPINYSVQGPIAGVLSVDAPNFSKVLNESYSIHSLT